MKSPINSLIFALSFSTIILSSCAGKTYEPDANETDAMYGEERNFENKNSAKKEDVQNNQNQKSREQYNANAKKTQN